MGDETICPECRAKSVNNSLKNREKDEYNVYQRNWSKIGLCYFCDNPVKKGYKVCEKHYQMNIEKAEKGRQTQAAQDYMKSVKKIQYRSVKK